MKNNQQFTLNTDRIYVRDIHKFTEEGVCDWSELITDKSPQEAAQLLIEKFGSLNQPRLEARYYGYNGAKECIVTYERLETDDEYSSRMKLERTRITNQEKRLAKIEQQERETLKKLEAKYGKANK